MELPKEILEMFENISENDEILENGVDEINSGEEKNEDIDSYIVNGESIKLDEEKEIEHVKKFDKTSKYEIVSKMAYLLGLDKERYDKNNYLSSIYEELEKNKHAKIIRSLCYLRIQSFMQSKKVFNIIKDEHRAIYAINEVYPSEFFTFLSSMNISFSEKSNYSIEVFEMEINKYIQERVSNIEYLFDWVDHSYIRELFIMPNGTEINKMKAEIDKYYQKQGLYPYSLYLNWKVKQVGNLLKDDLTFCWTIYDLHGKKFVDFSKVTDIAEEKKNAFYDFVDSYKKILLIVDCENTDVYRLMATFKGLNEDYLAKIYKIMLVDDPHTTEVWKVIPDYINIPIEYEEIERILENKSLVDQTIVMNVQREYDKEGIDGVIIASSDSDFFIIKKKIPYIGIFLLTQYTQTSQVYLETLANNGISFCHIDDFDSMNSDFIIRDVFTSYLRNYMKEKMNINVNELMNNILFDIHANLNEQEKKNFVDRYIRNLKLIIDEENNLKIIL